MPGVEYMSLQDLQSTNSPLTAGFNGAQGPALAPAMGPALKPRLDPDLNPQVDKLAHRLLLSAGREGAEFDGERWALIEEVLAFAAEAEQRITLQKNRINHLESLSLTDELTGLGNLRGLKRFLKRAIANAHRHDEYGVIGYFDLDGFKEINDQYGHAAGDKVLRHVADILKSKIRVSDLAARIGGDEFAVAMSRSGWGHGAARLVEFQQAINAAPVEIDGLRIPVRISMGIAPFGPSANRKEVLGHADEAMFADKRARSLKRQEKIAS